jgi:hypothetical protein
MLVIGTSSSTLDTGGYWAWLRLHHRVATGITNKSTSKLSPRYYGPYQVVDRVGPVAYRLQLPPKAKFHDVFHVVFPKQFVGTPAAAVVPLPPLSQGRVANAGVHRPHSPKPWLLGTSSSMGWPPSC